LLEGMEVLWISATLIRSKTGNVSEVYCQRQRFRHTGISIFEAVRCRRESSVDHWKNALVEVPSAVQQIIIFLGIVVLIRADLSIVARCGTL